MATVSIVYRKDKLNNNGEAPIHLRIIKDRKVGYVTAGIMLPEKYWDEKKHRIKPGFPNSSRLNSYLSNKFAELQDQVFEHETVSKSLSTHSLKEKIYGKKPTDFFAFAETLIESQKPAVKPNTYNKNRSTIAKLKEYHYAKTLNFQDITASFLMKYENHLRETAGNSTNTIHKDMKFIRQVFNSAYKDDIIEHHQNPFLKYHIKPEKTERCYLTEQELEQIQNLELPSGSRLELHRDMFVFAAYAGGLRVSDVLQLRWKNFDGSHLHLSIKKTTQQISIKLPHVAIEIIQKYKPVEVLADQFIFPMLSNAVDITNPVKLDTLLSSATAYINKNLGIICSKAGIQKHISFHVSRHTWATRALRKGITIDKVSKIMGHATIAQTQVYAKIVDEELDKAMEVFNL